MFLPFMSSIGPVTSAETFLVFLPLYFWQLRLVLHSAFESFSTFLKRRYFPSTRNLVLREDGCIFTVIKWDHTIFQTTTSLLYLKVESTIFLCQLEYSFREKTPVWSLNLLLDSPASKSDDAIKHVKQARRAALIRSWFSNSSNWTCCGKVMTILPKFSGGSNQRWFK